MEGIRPFGLAIPNLGPIYVVCRGCHRRKFHFSRDTRASLTTCCVQVAWGPLSFAAAVSIAKDSSLRYPLQLLVSLAHLYGVTLYYATCYAEHLYRNVSYSRPEVLYFGVYFIGMNAPWVVVPACKSRLTNPLHASLTDSRDLVVLFGSIRRIQRVFQAFKKVDSALQSSGRVTERIESKKTK